MNCFDDEISSLQDKSDVYRVAWVQARPLFLFSVLEWAELSLQHSASSSAPIVASLLESFLYPRVDLPAPIPDG
jgi:hypothetical protein